MLPFELASGDLRDELVAAVLAGRKTATSSLRVTYHVEGETLPSTGRYLLVDRDDQPVGVVDVLSVEIVPLGQVTDAVAIAEGEGFADATEWRRAHEAFWHASGEVAAAEAAVPGWALDDDTLVVVETFKLLRELLVTERLVLRPFTEDDADEFAAMNADPDVMTHFASGPLSRADSDALLHRCMDGFAEHGFGLGAVERADDAVLLGFTGLHHHRWFPGDIEVGWRLARHAWGNGYATEAALAWVDRAFGPLDLPRLISVTVPANLPSIAVMRRLGFELAEQVRREGVDLVVYARNRAS